MNHEDINENNSSLCSIYVYNLRSETEYAPESTPDFFLLQDIVIDSDESSKDSVDNSFSSILLCEPTKSGVDTCQKCIQECSSFYKKELQCTSDSNPSRKTPPKLCSDKELKNRNTNANRKTSKRVSGKQQKRTMTNTVLSDSVQTENNTTLVVPCSPSRVDSDSQVKSVNSALTWKSTTAVEHSLESVPDNTVASSNKISDTHESRFFEKGNKKDFLSNSSEKDVGGSVGKMAEHDTLPAVSCSEKRDTEVVSLTKKRCTFPVRRTKAKPLPILDDDDYPPRRKSAYTPSSNMVLKHDDRVGLPINRKLSIEATLASTKERRFPNVERNQHFVIQNHSRQPLKQSTYAILPEVATLNHKPNHKTVYSDSCLENVSPASLSFSAVSERTLFDLRSRAPVPATAVREEEVMMRPIEGNISPEITNDESENYATKSGINVAPCITLKRSELPTVGSDVYVVHEVRRGCGSEKMAKQSMVSYHPPEVGENNEKERSMSSGNNEMLFNYENVQSSASTRDFDSEHIISLLVLVNISKDFLGCLKDTFTSFVNEAKACQGDKDAFFRFLNDKGSVFLLEACQEMLVNCHSEQTEDINLSIKAFKEIFKHLNRFSTTDRFIDVQKLATATSHLSTSEISTFLKTFLKFRGCETISPTDFAFLCQKVVTCQLGMTLTSDNFQPNTTNPVSIDAPVPPPVFPSSSKGYFREPLLENGSLLGRLQPTIKPSISGHNEANVTSSVFCGTSSNNHYHDNCNDSSSSNSNNNSSKLPFALGREDLEKLVNNFSFLENEPRQAIRDYIKVLGVNEPRYAAFLLQRINKEEQIT